jgi:hypothetical protein
MSRLRLLSRSVACAVFVMSLSQLLYGSLAGKLIALPGIMFDAVLTVVIMTLTEPDAYTSIRFALPFNLVFYSTSCYALSWLHVQLTACRASGSMNSTAVD